MSPHLPSPPNRRGFTLVELLAVMSIIIIVTALARPALVSMTLGTSVTRSGATVEDALAMAHQHALASQRDTEVRFYKVTDPNDASSTPAYRSLQLFEQKADGSLKPLNSVVKLQNTMVVMNDPKYSSLLTSLTETTSTSADPNLPGLSPGTKYTYVQFAFRASGETDLTNKAGSYFLTVASSRSATPVNFYTVTVDPLTSKIISYRP